MHCLVVIDHTYLLTTPNVPFLAIEKTQVYATSIYLRL